VILAIDIGGTNFRVALADEQGRLVRVIRRSTEAEKGASWMIEQVIQLSRDLCDRHDVSAAGVGFGGPVDFADQRVINSTHVPGWDEVRLPEILSKALGVPVVVDNDANVGALGEYVYGAGRGASSEVYYTISTGIGGGIVIEGEIYRGANGNAGELGHDPILRSGPKCACGNRGCLEALCSGPAIARRASRKMGDKATTAKAVFDAARVGDPAAGEIVSEVVELLAMGVASTINALAPQVVVIGGGVSRAGAILFEPLRSSVRDRVMPVHREDVRILQAKRGDNAVLLGAVALAHSL
tara:strand:- start:531 stop:1424 length:894 start_codon:yes stop_codon:yes gene_type:complete